MKKHVLVLLLLVSITMLVGGNGCGNSDSSTPATPATYSILGTWAYTMLMGSNTWDSGTITFTGSDTGGTFTQINFYGVTYTGNYTVKGTDVAITGPETWTGTFSDALNMGGTWNSTSSSDAGTWTAIKQ